MIEPSYFTIITIDLIAATWFERIERLSPTLTDVRTKKPRKELQRLYCAVLALLGLSCYFYFTPGLPL